MKSLKDVLIEANINDLITFLNDNNIDVDNALSILKKHHSKGGINEKLYEEFFKKHGLSELNWGRKNSALKQFVNLFAEDNKLEILNNIIENDGIVSINDMALKGNLFNDYCKGFGFEEEAKIISTWTNSKSANAGPGEILLKFIIKEGNTRKTGDVGIGTDKEMEVKASTLNGSQIGSGGHAAGQKGDIRKTRSIYAYLSKHLFDENIKDGDADKMTYFQNNAGIKNFGKKLAEYKLTDNIENISNNIVNSLLYQYRFIEIDSTPDKKFNEINKNLYNNAADLFKKEKVIDKNGINNIDTFIDIIGAIQLYLYCLVEDFDYFCCLLLDKSETSNSPNNGNYILFKDPKNDLLKLQDVISKLHFGKLDSTTTLQGRTGKIFFRK
jgi:hypothetical protein